MDYIQSEIRLIHIDGGSQTTKPTEATANTEPQTPEQINNTRILILIPKIPTVKEQVWQVLKVLKSCR